MSEWYMTEDGEQLFVPVTTGWNPAQSIASEAAREVGDAWSHAAFVKRRLVELHTDECDWPYGCSDEDEPPRHAMTDCYVFEVVEGRYRE